MELEDCPHAEHPFLRSANRQVMGIQDLCGDLPPDFGGFLEHAMVLRFGASKNCLRKK